MERLFTWLFRRARRARLESAAAVRPNLLGVPLVPTARERQIFFGAAALCFYALAYGRKAW